MWNVDVDGVVVEMERDNWMLVKRELATIKINSPTNYY